MDAFTGSHDGGSTAHRDDRVPCLPNELLVQIFASLSADAANLDLQCRTAFLSLSTVSRRFRALILPQLFDHIVVEKDANEADITSPPTSSFCHALSQQLPSALSLAPLVLSCTFITHAPRASENGFRPVYSFAIRRLSNLQSLQIVNSSIGFSEQDDMLAAIGCLSNLSSLSFRGTPTSLACVTCRPDELKQLQALSSTLTTFDFYHAAIDPIFSSWGAYASLADCLPSFHKLTTISLQDAAGVRGFQASALQSGTCQQLEHIEFGMVLSKDVPLLSEFLNNTPCLQTLKVHVVSTCGASTSACPPLSIHPTSLRKLHTLLCPPIWFLDILPDRSIPTLHWKGLLASHPGKTRTYADPIEPCDEALRCRLPSLAVQNPESFAAHRSLYMYATTYRSLCRDVGDGIPLSNVEELTLDSMDVFKATDFEGLGPCSQNNTDPWPDMCTTSEILDSITSAINRTVRRVTLGAMCHWWDLQHQHRIVSQQVTVAFPAATTVRLSEWVEWRRKIDDATVGSVKGKGQESSATDAWEPHFYVDQSWQDARAFRRMIHKELSEAAITSRIYDFKGFFQSFVDC
ncbi:hypothetical protein BDV98DRAFT_227986 [Pterulicium gracile]|uniref:F-box domain-containing protein n=1 Tax=Pterulicium gracile TaxID=1884261 RepID=A0A5C3QW96_9AGAR|nr:hypothetical protein BDV98DRAFT_227986 [Pterula gracilis]